jgi:hypothetical protein
MKQNDSIKSRTMALRAVSPVASNRMRPARLLEVNLSSPVLPALQPLEITESSKALESL